MIKRLLIIVAVFVAFGIGFLMSRTVTSVNAKVDKDDKIDWCHCEPNGRCQSLKLPQKALEEAGHMDASGNPLHAGDHAGKCTEEEEKVDVCHWKEDKKHEDKSGWEVKKVNDIVSPDFEYGGTCEKGEGEKECKESWCDNNQPGDVCSEIDGYQADDSLCPDEQEEEDNSSDPGDQKRTDRVLSFNRLCNMDVELVLNYFDDGNGVKDKEIKFYYKGEEKIAKTNEAGRAGVTYPFKGEDDVEAKFDGDSRTTKVTDIQPSDCLATGQVLGATTGKVLGATTMAGTGAFGSTLANISGLFGLMLSAVGIRKYAKKS